MLDINKEFILLTELINNLWDGCNTQNAHNAIKFAFNSGLHDARIWINEHATMDIGEILSGKLCMPLDRYDIPFESDDSAYLHDALHRFDDNLCSGLSAIHRSATRYKRWNFSDSADSLCRKIAKNFGRINVTPKDQSEEIQRQIASQYKGLAAQEAGSFATPKRLLKGFVEYSRDEQGMSLFYSFFSVVYSHALYCAKVKNTETLIADLLPIYMKREDPINFDNGSEIMQQAMKNTFVRLVNEIKPFIFSSTKEYRESREKSKKAKAELLNETPQQTKARIDAIIERILNDSTNTDENDQHVDEIIDRLLPSVQAITV